MTDRPRLQLPIIPPLPSSKVLEKENGGEYHKSRRKSKETRPSPFTNRSLNHNETNITAKAPLPRNRTVTETKDLEGNRMGNNEFASRLGVLRSLETTDELFCLTSSTTPQHRSLCESIVSGQRADDPTAWLKALEEAVNSRNSSNGVTASDVLRLHRRASSRFQDFNKFRQEDEEAVLGIWLRYAACQDKEGSAANARSTYRYIMSQGIGKARSETYLEFAKFEAKEGEKQRARDIVTVGIENKAEPKSEIELFLLKLNVVLPAALSSSSKRDFTSLSKRKRKGTNVSSPKRSKSNDVRAIPMPEAQVEFCRNPADDVSSGAACCGTVFENELEQVSERGTATTDYFPPDASQRLLLNVEPECGESAPRQGCASQVAAGAVATKSNDESFTPLMRKEIRSRPGSSAKRSKLLSRTPRLRVTGLGKAQRVDPANQAADRDSDNDGDGDIVPTMVGPATDNVGLPGEHSRPVTKISKMDLSYMMEWDPDKYKKTLNSNETKEVFGPDSASKDPRTKIDEDKFRASSAVTSSPNKSTNNSGSMTTKSHNSNDSEESVRVALDRDKDTALIVTKTAKTASMPGSSAKTETRKRHDRLLSQIDTDFLPLIEEKNILRVKGEPYAKLGLIGKGGSCKVYRALSRACSVLAVKKVNIDGMDQKAIDGYANEISLLQRLRGNPAIIQMFDSEVSVAKKAIYIVMELGEVDLNHVLQNQAKLASAGGSKTLAMKLDLNFIRLTWQQMLKAVHCIHEERIIHGDLKPANFLFVRGTLKLIDFGIAKAIQSDDTTNIYRESHIGTLNYMSPETIVDTGGGGHGARMRMGRPSDVWSLGCILYQMVYGRTPFAHLKMIPKMQAIINPKHKIDYPAYGDEAAIDCIKRILRRQPGERLPIVGPGGLLNEHRFLNGSQALDPS